MSLTVNTDHIYIHSPDVIAREVDGSIVIIPITAGIGDLDNELFSLTSTGMVIWNKLDGKRSLKEIIIELQQEFDAPEGEIDKDVIELLTELLKKKIIIHKTED